ncbi:MAG: ATP-binding protein [Elainellaceae cyanobacterium]
MNSAVDLAPSLGPIVVSARLSQNMQAMAQVLHDRGFSCAVAPTMSAVVDAIQTDAATIVITEDVLAIDDAIAQLVEGLNQQPEWSDIPVVFLLKDCQRFQSCLTALREAQRQGALTLLETPLQTHSFITVIRSCLQHRQQQYKLRDTLQQLRESNQELESFSYAAAHDLKAPLRGIRNLSEWLSEDLSDMIPADSQAQLQLMGQRVERMETLLNDLLEYSRLGHTNQQIESIDVGELIQELLTAFQVSPDIVIRLVTPFPTLEGRALRLRRVFSNLISNAIKYGCLNQQGEITLSAKENLSWYEFAIADSGLGIDPVHHKKIFGIFETVRPADAQSTGIGLAIVKKLVEAEGGSVRVVSEVGQGATFYFTWPKRPHP